MLKKLIGIVSLLCVCGLPAWADTGSLTWTANTEPDLAGYKVYRSTVSGTYGAPLATLGKVTTYIVMLPQLTVDTRYFLAITAYDLAGNESAKSAEVNKLIVAAPVVTKPGMPVLTVSPTSPTSLTVSYPPVDDGAGGVATINVRYAVAPISWGSAPSAACSSSPCVIAGLLPNTTYEVQAVASRPGTPNVFGPLSMVMSATTLVLDVPPAAPGGLTISSATPDMIVIVASATDCTRVTFSAFGDTYTVACGQ